MAQKIEIESESANAISRERAGRLFKMVKLMSENSVQRAQLIRKLKVGTRTCYRDIDFLRNRGVRLKNVSGGYGLGESLDEALYKIPFPDPELTFGDVLAVMRGRSGSHKRLQKLFSSLGE